MLQPGSLSLSHLRPDQQVLLLRAVPNNPPDPCPAPVFVHAGRCYSLAWLSTHPIIAFQCSSYGLSQHSLSPNLSHTHAEGCHRLVLSNLSPTPVLALTIGSPVGESLDFCLWGPLPTLGVRLASGYCGPAWHGLLLVPALWQMLQCRPPWPTPGLHKVISLKLACFLRCW